MSELCLLSLMFLDRAMWKRKIHATNPKQQQLLLLSRMLHNSKERNQQTNLLKITGKDTTICVVANEGSTKLGEAIH